MKQTPNHIKDEIFRRELDIDADKMRQLTGADRSRTVDEFFTIMVAFFLHRHEENNRKEPKK